MSASSKGPSKQINGESRRVKKSFDLTRKSLKESNAPKQTQKSQKSSRTVNPLSANSHKPPGTEKQERRSAGSSSKIMSAEQEATDKAISGFSDKREDEERSGNCKSSAAGRQTEGLERFKNVKNANTQEHSKEAMTPVTDVIDSKRCSTFDVAHRVQQRTQMAHFEQSQSIVRDTIHTDQSVADFSRLNATQKLTMPSEKYLEEELKDLPMKVKSAHGREGSQSKKEILERNMILQPNAMENSGSLGVIPDASPCVYSKPTRPEMIVPKSVANWEDAAYLAGDDSPRKKKIKADAELNPPMPILPRALKIVDRPVECAIKSITFRKLKEFKSFPDQKRDKLGDKVEKPPVVAEPLQISPTKIITDRSQVQLNIEQNRLVQNIVYLRDTKILETLEKNINQLNQKDVFNHENYLDIKKLIKEREMHEQITENFPESIIRAKRALQQNFLPETTAKERTLQPLSNGGFIEERGDGSACYKLASREDRTLLFESRFESGNLFLATKVSDQEYDCLMQNDINTHGHTQWFYFRVQNTRAGLPVKFNILNYNKPDSMFNYGMKVTVYSERKSEVEQVGWHRSCTDISYFQNQIRKDFTYTKYFHTCTFTHTFEYDDDSVFFAYCFPYTYTDLVSDLNTIQLDPRRRKFINRQELCKTIAGVSCEFLTVTDGTAIELDDNGQEYKDRKRKGVVISARVHPGETVGSWMMRGILFFLTDPDNEEASLLRKNFVFKIIPMLNPDGVINGNYRCSLAGCDLNRRWKFPSKALQPTIYHCKKLIKHVHQERQVIMYCDLHGHSRKPNVFMYGCNNPKVPEECRTFPMMLSKVSRIFEFGESKFGVQKSKESTARVAVFKELKTVPMIYTMESTFSGMTINEHAGMHIDVPLLESMGRDLVRTLLTHQNICMLPELRPLLTPELMATMKVKTFSAESDKVTNEETSAVNRMLAQELRNNKELLKQGDGDETSGSDSEPSEDNLEPAELIKNLPTVDKNLSKALKKQNSIKKADKEKKGEKSPKRIDGNFQKKDADTSPIKRNRAIQLHAIKEERKENDTPPKLGKDGKPIKPKPVMVDAVTQTERSDYFQIKVRNVKKQLRALEAEAAEALKGSDKMALENLQKEIKVLQIKMDKLMKEDPKHSAAPPSGIIPQMKSSNEAASETRNHISDNTPISNRSREPKDILLKRNAIKQDNRQEAYSQQMTKSGGPNSQIQTGGSLMASYTANTGFQFQQSNNTFWSQADKSFPGSNIPTDRNVLSPYFQHPSNSNLNKLGSSVDTHGLMHFDTMNSLSKQLTSQVKNVHNQQRPTNQPQLPSNGKLQPRTLRPTGSKSTAYAQEQQASAPIAVLGSAPNQAVPVSNIFKTPQKLATANSFDKPNEPMGRYASLQHKQMAGQGRVQQKPGGPSSNPTRGQAQLNFSGVLNQAQVHPVHGGIASQPNGQQFSQNMILQQPDSSKDVLHPKSSIQSIKQKPQHTQKQAVNMGGGNAFPDVLTGGSMQKELQRPQISIRNQGKVQIGATIARQYSPSGKRQIAQPYKLSEKISQGEFDNSNGGFLPIFQQRKQ